MLFSLSLGLSAGCSGLLGAAAQSAAANDFLAQWLEGWNLGGMILMLVGMALIITEMLMPGFGIAGVAGIAAIVAGLIVGSDSIGAALFSLFLVLIVLLIAAAVIFKVIFGKRRKPSSLVLDERIDSVAGTREKDNAGALVGHSGVALTALRPSGIAMIDGRRMDVLAEGEFIAKGDKLTVAAVHGTRISVVRTKD